MKFSTAFSVAITTAFAPSLVSAANISISVGATGLVFTPQQVTAQRGDLVLFEFRGGNHTVTQSSFANPCAWQFNTVTNQNGFNSGFVPYNQASGQVGVYSLEIANPDSPIWFFCGRPPHCKGGMYGAINAPATGDRTFAQFAANVLITEEPGLGVTVPFTPSTGSSSISSVSTPTTTIDVSSPSGAVPLIKTGTATPNQSTGAAGSITAHFTVILGLVGLAAGLVL